MITLLLASCYLKAPPELEVHEGPSFPEDVGRLALSPSLVLGEIEGAVLADAFRENLFVGNITFSGGYVVEEAAGGGMQTRSKVWELNAQELYSKQAREVLDRSLGELLTAEKMAWTRLDAPVAVQLPRRSEVRGTHPLDGGDNVNLPRITLEPTSIQPVPGYDSVLVPLIVAYYTHNGGWFLGQEVGCGSGARFRVLWSVHEAATGAVRAWGDVDVKSLDPYLFSPSSAQVQDLLIEAEGRMASTLARELR